MSTFVTAPPTPGSTASPPCATWRSTTSCPPACACSPAPRPTAPGSWAARPWTRRSTWRSPAPTPPASPSSSRPARTGRCSATCSWPSAPSSPGACPACSSPWTPAWPCCCRPTSWMPMASSAAWWATFLRKTGRRTSRSWAGCTSTTTPRSRTPSSPPRPRRRRTP